MIEKHDYYFRNIDFNDPNLVVDRIYEMERSNHKDKILNLLSSVPIWVKLSIVKNAKSDIELLRYFSQLRDETINLALLDNPCCQKDEFIQKKIAIKTGKKSTTKLLQKGVVSEDIIDLILSQNQPEEVYQEIMLNKKTTPNQLRVILKKASLETLKKINSVESIPIDVGRILARKFPTVFFNLKDEVVVLSSIKKMRKKHRVLILFKRKCSKKILEILGMDSDFTVRILSRMFLQKRYNKKIQKISFWDNILT